MPLPPMLSVTTQVSQASPKSQPQDATVLLPCQEPRKETLWMGVKPGEREISPDKLAPSDDSLQPKALAPALPPPAANLCIQRKLKCHLFREATPTVLHLLWEPSVPTECISSLSQTLSPTQPWAALAQRHSPPERPSFNHPRVYPGILARLPSCLLFPNLTSPPARQLANHPSACSALRI